MNTIHILFSSYGNEGLLECYMHSRQTCMYFLPRNMQTQLNEGGLIKTVIFTNELILISELEKGKKIIGNEVYVFIRANTVNY